MIYESARSRIKPGDLLSWSHRGWGSWYDLQIQAVRMFTRSEHCHVGIALRWRSRLWVIEAVRPLVRVFLLSKLRPFYHIPMPAQWTEEVEEWALDQVGKQYSRRQAVLAGLDRLKGGADDKWQCAELAQACLERAMMVIPGPATPTNVVEQALKYDGGLWPVE